MTHRLPSRHSGMASTRGGKGFSLLEMIIVVSVAMVLLGFAIPVILSAVRNYALNSAASNLTRMTQLARMAAIRQSGFACARLQGNFFWVDVNCDSVRDNTEVAYAVPVGVMLVPSGPATTSMNFSSPPTPLADPFLIRFNSRGGTTVAPTVSLIYLRGQGGNSAAVTVSGVGRARSWRYGGDSWY